MSIYKYHTFFIYSGKYIHGSIFFHIFIKYTCCIIVNQHPCYYHSFVLDNNIITLIFWEMVLHVKKYMVDTKYTLYIIQLQLTASVNSMQDMIDAKYNFYIIQLQLTASINSMHPSFLRLRGHV